MHKTKLFANIIILILTSFLSGQPTVGLIYIDTTQVFNGYTLFAPNTAKTTYLIDIDGKLVNQWESDFVAGLTTYFLEDGHLLRSAAIADPSGIDNNTGGFQKFDWDNNLVWQFYYGTQHHDIEPLSNGNVLLLINEVKNKNAAIQAGRDPNLIFSNSIISLSIIEVKQTAVDSAEIVWQWNAWDHLIQEFDASKNNFGSVREHPELMDINFANGGAQDWLHTNSISYNAAFDQILVSNRNTKEIWIIDHSTTTEEAASHSGGISGKGGDLLYRWGNPIAYQAGNVGDQKLFGQHDAYWIKSGLPGAGNIMIFNNGIGRPAGNYSSIEEIVPPVDEVGQYSVINGNAFPPNSQIWTFTTPDPFRFSSPKFGGSQRLLNGNTLICNSNSGEFFEVTSSEEIVWQYINPVAGDTIFNQGETEINKNQVFRCYRYPVDYPGFVGKDLTPGNPIEIYPTVRVDTELSGINEFKLHNNFPNPFNPETTIEFTLNSRGAVNLIIYDLLGNEIRNLTNHVFESGLNSIIWDSRDDYGSLVSSGVYIYSLQAGQNVQNKKMVLIR